MAHVRRRSGAGNAIPILADNAGTVIPIACEFFVYVAARGCSPNTVTAYAYDLAHLWRFLEAADLSWDQLTPHRAPEFLSYLRSVPSKVRGKASGPVLAATNGELVERPKLSAATVNRTLAAVSAFYDWAILSGHFDGPNPITRIIDRSVVMASDRHRPFLTSIAPMAPSARTLRVRTPRRLPRPLDPEQIAQLLPQLRCRRDLAMVRLMLDGGLRPGEVLSLHLTDVAYGRRRVVVRHRDESSPRCSLQVAHRAYRRPA